jgi:hypothetical protein
MKRILLIASLVYLAQVSIAQKPQFPRLTKANDRYWLLGIGNSTQNMYDEAISYVRYKGTGISPYLSLIKSSEKKYRHFVFQASVVKLTTERSNALRPMEVRTTRFALSYQYLKKIKQWNKNLKLYAGGDLTFLFNLKTATQLDNSQLVYDYAMAIGPSAKLDKAMNWRKRECTVSYTLSVPLLSHIARPYYLNRIEFIDPKNDFTRDLFKNSSITSISKNLRIISGLYFTYPLFNKNALRVGYAWDFYKTKTINTVYAAEHLASIAFLSNY